MATNIYEQLIRDEGNLPHPYRDTVGKLTIGVGHNLDAKGLSWRARMVILGDDVEDAERDLMNMLPWTQQLSAARRGVLINMTFNMGIGGLMEFKKMLTAMREARWEEARKEMLDSTYAKQVGERAVRLGKQLVTNVWQ